MEKARLVAAEISCDHCIASVRKAVTLRYDPTRHDLTALKAAMAGRGFPAAK